MPSYNKVISVAKIKKIKKICMVQGKGKIKNENNIQGMITILQYKNKKLKKNRSKLKRSNICVKERSTLQKSMKNEEIHLSKILVLNIIIFVLRD